MAQDVLLFTQNIEAAKIEIEESGGRVTQKFSPEVFIAHLPEPLDVNSLQNSQSSSQQELDPTMDIVVRAWEAPASAQSRSPLATEGLVWSDSSYESPEHDDEAVAGVEAAPTAEDEQESTGTPTSLYLIGSVAVGIVVVSGSTDSLRISQAEYTKIVQEVQEGLNFLANAESKANLLFDYDLHFLTVSVQPGTSCGSPAPYEKCEAPWRNAALQQLGYPGSRSGSRQYVQALRTSKGTDWAYVAYFTKYPLRHFAYAGQERLVMAYANDGWGPDNINRVFAHETGHIFGAADEYGGCGCGPSGYLQFPNNNCVNCTNNQVSCLMNANTLSLCTWSRGQIGWRFWEQVSGRLKYVSVASDGTVWGVNSDDNIYRYLGNNNWQQISGRLKHVSVGNANSIWGVNSNDNIYHRV